MLLEVRPARQRAAQRRAVHRGGARKNVCVDVGTNRQAETHADNLLVQLVDDMHAMWNSDSFLDP